MLSRQPRGTSEVVCHQIVDGNKGARRPVRPFRTSSFVSTVVVGRAHCLKRGRQFLDPSVQLDKAWFPRSWQIDWIAKYGLFPPKRSWRPVAFGRARLFAPP